MQAGDELLAAGDRRIFGQADFRGVLHREANPTGSILIRWLRDGRLMSGTLELGEGWRETVVWWRSSVSGGNIGSGPGFWPLRGPRDGVEARRNGGSSPWWGQNARERRRRNRPGYGVGMSSSLLMAKARISFAREFQYLVPLEPRARR